MSLQLAKAAGGIAELQRPSTPADAPAGLWPAPELSIVVPTFNEGENVAVLVSRLAQALKGVHWEAIFVDDDSPDGTARIIRRLAATDPRVRCIRRVGRRGLSGACIEGILASSAYAVAVLDADLQHDESLLPRMLACIGEGADLVVGTRFAQGGATDGLGGVRTQGSRLANAAARLVLGVRLSDPMSGYFMLRRELFDAAAPRLSGQGFKILLDFIASAPAPMRIEELPYRFRPRLNGQSKLDSLVVLDYLGLLLAKLSGDRLSIRFLMFALVGASGLIVHLMGLRAVLGFSSVAFDLAQTLAAYIAMTWNFALNNQLTYRDRRLKGWQAFKGLLSFYAVCSLGAVANVGVASWVYSGKPSWWLAGTAGAIMGAVFNYAASSTLTWRQR